MSENTGAAGTPVDPTTQPQAGADSPPQAGGAQTAQAASATAESGTEATEVMSLEEARKLRKEHNQLRAQLAQFEKAQAEAEAAKLSDLEKATKRIAELERELSDREQREQESRTRSAIIAAAGRLGYNNPELAVRLVDRTQVTYAEDGTPKNVDKLLSDLANADPYLVRSQPQRLGGAWGGAEGGKAATGSPSMNDLLRAAARGQ